MKKRQKGVELYGKKFRARIWDGKKNVNLGTFNTEKEAADVYFQAKIKKLTQEYGDKKN